jgi:hypothetical protein
MVVVLPWQIVLNPDTLNKADEAALQTGLGEKATPLMVFPANTEYNTTLLAVFILMG